jgi:UDP-N-acetylglucosamine 2-epimerase (non-hydrolysing)
MNLLLCYGCRPEWHKIKPVIDILKNNGFPYRILFTGQHPDIASFDYDLYITPVDGISRLDSIAESIVHEFPILHQAYKFTHVLVQGDTTSALAVAFSAFNNGVKVIHLEAGLRTYDNENPYPEEANRRMISQITDIHLCPTEQARENLINERVRGLKYEVGNTVIDGLSEYKKECDYINRVMVTMHRRENHPIMDQWFTEINNIAKRYPDHWFIFPLHPNPNVQKHINILTAENITITSPIDRNVFLQYLVKSKLVITDSGGVQEECSFFNKICLVCRRVTERPEVIGKSTFLIEEPAKLSQFFDKFVKEYKIDYDCPFGDGHSAEYIYDILKKL